MTEIRRLEKSNTDKVIARVAGGLSEYLDVDPVVVRIAWVVLCFITAGLGVLLYIATALIMPRQGTVPVQQSEAVVKHMEEPADTTVEYDASMSERRDWRRYVFAIGLIFVGLFALASNFGLLSFVDWGQLRPVVIIGLGGFLLVSRFRGR